MQIGGPDGSFKNGAFAGGYWDEAGFGVTSAVDQGKYGQGKPNISRRLFKAYNAVKTFYTDSSQPGSELYLTRQQFAAIENDIQQEIHHDRRKLHQLHKSDVPHEASVRRLLQTEIAVLEARRAFPADQELMELDQMLDSRESLSQAGKKRVMTRLHARLAELRPGG
jgi:hypothetical protein